MQPIQPTTLKSTVNEAPDLSAWNDLRGRAEESYREKDGSSYLGIFDPGLSAQLPMWKTTGGDKFIDILPYLSGPRDPKVLAGRMQEGAKTYLLQAYMHKNVGPNQDRYMCLAKTLNLPCPICEHKIQLSKDPDCNEEEIKLLRPTKFPTCVYNIWDRDQEGKGVQVWEISTFFMESKLQAIARQPRGGGYILYAHPGMGEDGGRHLAFTIEMKGQNMEFKGHQFQVRREPIPKRILDSVYQLDAYIKIPDYDEVYQAFWGGSMEHTGLTAQQEAQVEETADTFVEGVRITCTEFAVGHGLYQDCAECEKGLFVLCKEKSPHTASQESVDPIPTTEDYTGAFSKPEEKAQPALVTPAPETRPQPIQPAPAPERPPLIPSGSGPASTKPTLRRPQR